MIKSIEHLSAAVKAGVLARTAFSLDDTSYSLARPVLDGELGLRNVLIHELRGNLGLAVDDDSASALQKLEDAIDDQLSILLQPQHETELLRKMVGDGDLPSDSFSVELSPNYAGATCLLDPRDYARIQETVKNADREQHLKTVEDTTGKKLEMISIFAKNFVSDNPFNSFVGLVVAHRGENLVMTVLMFVRIYEKHIHSGSGDLIEVLRRFSDAYGSDFKYNGTTYRFIWHPESHDEQHGFDILPNQGRDGRGNLVEKRVNNQFLFSISGNGKISTVLLFVVNLTKYERSLKAHSWTRDFKINS